jgi:hypothetical protein
MKFHILLTIALAGTALAQGPLTPPPGADPSVGPVNALNGGLPQAAMKTLHQVEPRTAIPGGTSGMTISTSGAYYLTGNITVATGDGITINASNVTLDLNGFSISSSSGTDIGIALSSTTNLAIFNGSISGFSKGAAPVNGQQTPRNVRMSNLAISGCAGYSVFLDVAKNTCVQDCLVDGGFGIAATLVNDCSVTNGSINGRIVRNCSVTGATFTGITADVAENCYAESSTTAIQSKCLVNSYGRTSGSSSYALSTVSAGVANNVWADGLGGGGDAINASTVANSVGLRPSDPSPPQGSESNGPATGSGIEATIIQGSMGLTNQGLAVKGSVVISSHGSSAGGRGISATVVTASNGQASGGNGSIGISGEVISQSNGMGDQGLSAERGVIANSTGKSTGSSGAIIAPGSVVTGVNGSDNNATRGGIVSTGGLVTGSMATLYGIEAPGGLVAQSFGIRILSGGGNEGGVEASVVTDSKGLGANNDPGIFADLIHGSYGTGTGGTTSGTFKFNSN